MPERLLTHGHMKNGKSALIDYSDTTNTNYGETDLSHFAQPVKGSVIFYREGGLWKFFKFCKFLVIPPLYE